MSGGGSWTPLRREALRAVCTPSTHPTTHAFRTRSARPPHALRTPSAQTFRILGWSRTYCGYTGRSMLWVIRKMCCWTTPSLRAVSNCAAESLTPRNCNTATSAGAASASEGEGGGIGVQAMGEGDAWPPGQRGGGEACVPSATCTGLRRRGQRVLPRHLCRAVSTTVCLGEGGCRRACPVLGGCPHQPPPRSRNCVHLCAVVSCPRPLQPCPAALPPHWLRCTERTALPPPRVTLRPVVVFLRGPGQSPALPFACCVGSLRCDGRCGRCSCWCRFRVRASGAWDGAMGVGRGAPSRLRASVRGGLGPPYQRPSTPPRGTAPPVERNKAATPLSINAPPPCPAPPPPCDSPSGCCSFTGPWTVPRSSLRMLRRVAAF